MNPSILYRGKIVLKPFKEVILDYNYNQGVAGLIYSALNASNSRYKKLHDDGFEVDGKTYKLFNFTVRFENAEFLESGIKINSETKVILIVSGVYNIVQSIAKSILNLKSVWIFNNEFGVTKLEKDNFPKFKNTMLYNTYSGIIESYREEIEGKNKIIYTEPTQELFFNQLAINLKRKYKLVYKREYKGPLYFDVDDIFSIKKKKIKIKENCVKPSWLMQFWLQADVDMQKIAYYLGVGQQTSFGLGCLYAVTGRNEKI